MLLWIIIVVGLVVVVGIAVRNGQKSLAAYERVVAREGLELTDAPCGLTESKLADLDICPQGGRRHGLRFGASGPMTIELGGEPVEVEVAAFQWWWEEHQREQEGSGTWTEQDQAVAAVRLPVELPHVTIGQEGRLARWGLGGRDDVQVESEEFNRRFDVADHGSDPQLLVRLLSPGFQQTLVEDFDGRDVELVGDVLLLAGNASDGPLDEPDLQGIVTQLPGVRHDAARLASALPSSFLRGVDGGGGGSAAP